MTPVEQIKRKRESFACVCLILLHQKRILETYAKQNGFTNLRWYTDDGFSGANFVEVR